MSAEAAANTKIRALVKKMKQVKGFVKAAKQLVVLCDQREELWDLALACGVEAVLRPYLNVVILDKNCYDTPHGVATRVYLAAAASNKHYEDLFFNDAYMELLGTCLRSSEPIIATYGLHSIKNLTDPDRNVTYRWEVICERTGDDLLRLFMVCGSLSDVAAVMLMRIMSHCRLVRLPGSVPVADVVTRAVRLLLRGSTCAGGLLVAAMMSVDFPRGPCCLCPEVHPYVQQLVDSGAHWKLFCNLTTCPALRAVRLGDAIPRPQAGLAMQLILQTAVETDSSLGNIFLVLKAVLRLFRCRKAWEALGPPAGYQVVHLAAEEACAAALKSLTDVFYLAHATTDVTRFTPLMLAVMSNSHSMVRALMAHGGLEETCIWDATALELAACAGRTGCMRILLEAGALQRNSLLIAAFWGRTQAARLLLRLQRPPPLEKVEEALEVAVKARRRDVAWLLRRAGARGAPAPPAGVDQRWNLLCQKSYLYAVVRKLDLTAS